MSAAKDVNSVPLLSVDKVTRRFGGLTAVSEVSLDVNDGEIMGIIGPNGAGKTTLFNVISGHLRTSAGTVSINGRVVTRLPAHQRARLEPFSQCRSHLGCAETRPCLGKGNKHGDQCAERGNLCRALRIFQRNRNLICL